MNYEISNALYERLLDEIGLSFEIDLLHGIIFPVVSFIGFLFNLINILILRDACFNTVFYKYLKIYCFNSLIINIFSSFVFISHARHFSKLSNSYVSIAYFCYIFIPIVNTYYFYGTVLDILITIERISIFISKLKLYCKKVFILCLSAFIFCTLINTPYYFVFQPDFS